MYSFLKFCLFFTVKTHSFGACSKNSSQVAVFASFRSPSAVNLANGTEKVQKTYKITQNRKFPVICSFSVAES